MAQATVLFNSLAALFLLAIALAGGRTPSNLCRHAWSSACVTAALSPSV